MQSAHCLADDKNMNKHLAFPALLFVASLGEASAFVPDSQPCFRVGRRSGAGFTFADVTIYMSDGAPEKKSLTAAERIANARKAIGLPDEPEPEKLFEDDLLDDMRECLLKLEKRAKEGAGALDATEVEEFEAAMGRVAAEMNAALAESEKGASSPSAAPTAAAPAGPAASSIATTQSTHPLGPPAPEPVTAEAVAREVSPVEKPAVIDTSNDEGPAYDGKGGMGLASGTRNTYVIPGMDEMTPEEYRKALQKSVSDRQSARKGSRGGMVGNRAAHDYLNQLGWGGASGSLAGGGPPAHAPVPEPTVPAPAPVPPPVIQPPVQPPIAAVAELHPAPHVPVEYEQVAASEAHHLVDKVIDTSNDEGPAYDGKGGMGLASGTRNTYIIPGMDEMTPEAYMKALQKSVSDRQSGRKDSRGGMVGNRAAHEYLNQLGWGGASHSLAGREKSDQ